MQTTCINILSTCTSVWFTCSAAKSMGYRYSDSLIRQLSLLIAIFAADLRYCDASTETGKRRLATDDWRLSDVKPDWPSETRPPCAPLRFRHHDVCAVTNDTTLPAHAMLKKVKFSHTRYRALGPELISVYRQSARR